MSNRFEAVLPSVTSPALNLPPAASIREVSIFNIREDFLSDFSHESFATLNPDEQQTVIRALADTNASSPSALVSGKTPQGAGNSPNRYQLFDTIRDLKDHQSVNYEAKIAASGGFTGGSVSTHLGLSRLGNTYSISVGTDASVEAKAKLEAKFKGVGIAAEVKMGVKGGFEVVYRGDSPQEATRIANAVVDFAVTNLVLTGASQITTKLVANDVPGIADKSDLSVLADTADQIIMNGSVYAGASVELNDLSAGGGLEVKKTSSLDFTKQTLTQQTSYSGTVSLHTADGKGNVPLGADLTLKYTMSTEHILPESVTQKNFHKKLRQISQAALGSGRSSSTLALSGNADLSALPRDIKKIVPGLSSDGRLSGAITFGIDDADRSIAVSAIKQFIKTQDIAALMRELHQAGASISLSNRDCDYYEKKFGSHFQNTAIDVSLAKTMCTDTSVSIFSTE